MRAEPGYCPTAGLWGRGPRRREEGAGTVHLAANPSVRWVPPGGCDWWGCVRRGEKRYPEAPAGLSVGRRRAVNGRFRAGRGV